MKSQYHTFLKSESLKLSKLKVGDRVREDTSGKVSKVTKITSKRFAVGNGSSTQSPLKWTRLSRVGEKIYDINAKLEKLGLERDHYVDMLKTGKYHMNEYVGNMYKQVQQQIEDLMRQSDVFLWNIANGKSEAEGGADDGDLNDYLTNEDELEFNKAGGESDRDKVKQWLIKKGIEEPPPEISCVIS